MPRLHARSRLYEFGAYRQAMAADFLLKQLTVAIEILFNCNIY